MTRVVSAALLLALIAGCADRPTQVVVTIDAESTWRSATSSVRVVVRGGAGGDAGLDSPSRDVTLMVGEGESYRFPVDVTVAPLEGDATRTWAVDATARNTVTDASATVRVRGTYVSGRTLRVSLLLENTCAGIVCESDETCRAGACVDAGLVTGPVDAGTDAGADTDAGRDGGVLVDGVIPQYCPNPDVRTPDPDAGTFDDSDGGRPVYPELVPCPTVHAIGAACNETPAPDDICYSAVAQGGVAYCRTPCSLDDADGGVLREDPICATVHPDSRCTAAMGYDLEPHRMLCSVPCNPFDDVGCPAGLHCAAVPDFAVGQFVTECLELVDDPRHQLEPCAVLDNAAYWTPVGCAPGYTCGYDDVCEAGREGAYVCVQICDAAPVAPRVACPPGFSCYRILPGGFDDTIGPLTVGRCGT